MRVTVMPPTPSLETARLRLEPISICFVFVSGEEPRQVWLLKAADWKTRSR